MTLFGSRNIQLSVKAHINKKVDVIIFALLRAPTDKEGKRKKTPWTSENTELSLAGLHRARTTTIFRAFSLLCFIYSSPSLTGSSVLKVNNFWASISPFSLKDWLRRADQNRGQVDNQSRIQERLYHPLKCFGEGLLGSETALTGICLPLLWSFWVSREAFSYPTFELQTFSTLVCISFHSFDCESSQRKKLEFIYHPSISK